MTPQFILRAAISSMLAGKREPRCYSAHEPGKGYTNKGTDPATRADYLRQLERASTSELENLGYAPGYAGYKAENQPMRGVLMANWNKFPRGTDTLLERAGFTCEWSDCYSTCADCNKAIETEPSSFSWKPFYNRQRIEHGEMVCLDCEPENQFFLFELRDSDGNDCIVTDLIVEAQTLDDAREKAGDALTDLFPTHGTDGCWGTFAPCDCYCEHQSVGFCELEACERMQETLECSHGGATVNGDDDTVTGYETFEEAREHGSKFHRAILIDANGSVR